MKNKISNVSVEILVNGNPVKIHEHEGKLYVEARENSEYQIQVNNQNNHRILVIGAIDGLDWLNGESSNGNGSGYVIDGNEKYNVKGFRVSNEKVGAFKFTNKNNSYAAEKGKEAVLNCGVIGLKFVKEKIKYVPPVTWPKYPKEFPEDYDNWPWNRPWPVNPWVQPKHPHWNDYPIFTCNTTRSLDTTNSLTCSLNSTLVGYSNSTNCSSDIKQNESNWDLGTTFGKSLVDVVKNTEFERGLELGVLEIYYASRESLQKMGVSLVRESKVNFPKAFPENFCTPPKNWVD